MKELADLILMRGKLSDSGRYLFNFDRYWAEHTHSKLRQNLRREPITAPVFITGTGRTASSMLHALLRDRGFRVANVAEAYTLSRSLTSMSTGTGAGWIAWDVDKAIRCGDQASPEYAMVNAHQWCDPAEDIHFDRSCWGAGWWLPHYGGIFEWAADRMFADPAGEYRHQRACAELIGMPDDRWCFRSPVHLMRLPALFAEFPDAHVIWLERAAEQVQPSLRKMIAAMRSTRSEHVDHTEVAMLADQMTNFGPAVAQADIDAGKVPLDRLIRVAFEDLVENTAATVDALAVRVGAAERAGSRR